MNGKSTKKRAATPKQRVAAKATQVAKTTSVDAGETPSELIDARIKKLGDWRGKTLAHVRALIKRADPEVVEEVKWREPSNSMLGVPVWSHDGITSRRAAAVPHLPLTPRSSLRRARAAPQRSTAD